MNNQNTEPLNLPQIIIPPELTQLDDHINASKLGPPVKKLLNLYYDKSALTSLEDVEKISKRKKLEPLKISKLPSQIILDKFPKPPIRSKPAQKVMKIAKEIEIKRPILYISAASLLNQTELSNYEKCITKPGVTNDERPGSKKLLVRDDHINYLNNFTRIFRNTFNLIDFRPVLPPFVPQLLKILINDIELYCSKNSWSVIFETLNDYYEKSKEVFIKIINSWYKYNKFKKSIKTLPVEIKIMLVRLFLNELDIKPLHFKQKDIMKLIKYPLYDLILEPNQSIRTTVLHTILCSSCVQLDTLAFLMIHFLHALEYSEDKYNDKHKLVNIYGNLIITFDEIPGIKFVELDDPIHSSENNYRTVESWILEAILDVCDYQFWTQSTMLRITKAFKFLSDRERYYSNHSMRKQNESMGIYNRSLGKNDQDTQLTNDKFTEPIITYTLSDDNRLTEDYVEQKIEDCSESWIGFRSSHDFIEKRHRRNRQTRDFSQISLTNPHILPYTDISLLKSSSHSSLSQNRRSTYWSTMVKWSLLSQRTSLDTTRNLLKAINDCRVYLF